ncbi:MAG: tetratricopeptide repeat protein [Planctomycetota bacterium]
MASAMLLACMVASGCGSDGTDDNAPMPDDAQASAVKPDAAVEQAIEPGQRVPVPPSFDAFDDATVAHMKESINAVRTSPQRPEGWSRLGMVYHANQLLDLAQACYDQALRLRPNAARPMYYSAILSHERGDTPSAITIGKRVRAAAPTYVPAQCRLAEWHYEVGGFDEALVVYESVLARAPKFGEAVRGRARILIQRRAWDEVISSLVAYLETNDDDGYARNLLATAYRGRGDAGPDAEGMVGTVSATASPIHDPWLEEMMLERRGVRQDVKRADRMIEEGKLDEAFALFDQLYENAPDDTTVLAHMHRAYRNVGRTAEALPLIERAVSLRPTFHMLHIYHAGTLLELARAASPAERTELIERAIASAERACALRPTYAYAHVMLSDALFQAGRIDDAATAAYDGAKLERTAPALYRSAAIRLVEAKRWAEVIEMASELNRLEPDDPGTLYLLGGALANNGDSDAAMTVLRKAAGLAPDNEQIRNALTQLENAENNG